MGLLQLRLTVFSDGEHMPVLVDQPTGVPNYEAVLYLLTRRRSRRLACNTLIRDAAAIRHLYLWAATRKIDLVDRFSKAEYLNLSEVDSLAGALALFYQDLLECLEAEADKSLRPSRPRLHTVLNNAGYSRGVLAETAAGRFDSITAYIAWLAEVLEPRTPTSPETMQGWRTERTLMVERVAERATAHPATSIDARLGLTEEHERRLRSLVKAGSNANPWVDPFVQSRNDLLVTMLLDLGMRRSELLGIRVSDINFQSNEVSITRHPDDPDDPRVVQPNTKTLARDLRIDDALASKIHDHVMNHRRNVFSAASTDFLLISRNGTPLSGSAMSKIFTEIRNAEPILPSNLSAHLLRHTWNDRYSSLMQQRKTPATLEIRTRSYLMGWSETSGTAARYTRRYIKNASEKASLALQRAKR